MMHNTAAFTRYVPLLFVLLWSTGFIGAKYALPYIEPFYLLFIRMLITLGVFIFLCFLFKAPWPTFQQGKQQMVAGFLVHACYLGGVFAALKWQLPAGVTAIIVGLQPLVTALMGWRWRGEQLNLSQWSGLSLGLIGVVLVLLFGQLNQQAEITEFKAEAIIAALLSLASISIGTLYQKRYGKGVNLLTGSVYQYFSTAIAMGLLAYFFEDRVVQWEMPLILSLTWLVFGLSVSAILLLMLMIREGESAKVASYFYLVPPVTAVEAWLLFGESMSLIQMIAIVITVLGVYLVVRPSRPRVDKC